MPQIKDSKTLAAAGGETIVGLQPSSLSAPAAASPELLDRPRRRTFTAQDKLRILGRSTALRASPERSARSCAARGFTRQRCRTGGVSAPPAPSKRRAPPSAAPK